MVGEDEEGATITEQGGHGVGGCVLGDELCPMAGALPEGMGIKIGIVEFAVVPGHLQIIGEVTDELREDLPVAHVGQDEDEALSRIGEALDLVEVCEVEPLVELALAEVAAADGGEEIGSGTGKDFTGQGLDLVEAQLRSVDDAEVPLHDVAAGAEGGVTEKAEVVTHLIDSLGGKAMEDELQEEVGTILDSPT